MNGIPLASMAGVLPALGRLAPVLLMRMERNHAAGAA
jgi:hypothetical protein